MGEHNKTITETAEDNSRRSKAGEFPIWGPSGKWVITREGMQGVTPRRHKSRGPKHR